MCHPIRARSTRLDTKYRDATDPIPETRHAIQGGSKSPIAPLPIFKYVQIRVAVLYGSSTNLLTRARLHHAKIGREADDFEGYRVHRSHGNVRPDARRMYIMR